MAYNILILGAAYGSLLASKMLFGGHKIHHVCLPAEADLINAEGFRVRLPVKGRKEPVEIDSRKLPGKVSAAGPADVEPTEYDLICLAMQEPQYRSPGVRQLLDAVGRSKVPCMSIMNMPPLPYLKRIPALAKDGPGGSLYQCPGLGTIHARPRDALLARSAGLPSPRGGGERPACRPADKLQGSGIRK